MNYGQYVLMVALGVAYFLIWSWSAYRVWFDSFIIGYLTGIVSAVVMAVFIK